jgi:hypothetical protein
MFMRIARAARKVLSPSAGGQTTAAQGRDMVTHHGLVLGLSFRLCLFFFGLKAQ